jgi:hypothetical protein
MDDRVLFDRMHDALDIEPPAGGFERMRSALAKSPATPHGWPVFRMRGSKMGFRLAAGLTLLVLVGAIVAAYLSAHNATSSRVPAGSGQTIAAYQNLVNVDDQNAINTWSAPCDTSTHTGCQGDATRAIVALQHWLDDLNRSEPPARFLIVDAQLRLHLSGSIAALNALLAASQANDSNAMDRAYLVGLAGRAWTDTVVPSIVSSQQVSGVAYINAFRPQSNLLTSCTNCQNLVGQGQIDCSQTQTPTCQDLLDSSAGVVAVFQSTLVAFAAPASLSAKDARLQQDLARADSALIAMGAALSTGNQASFDAGRMILRSALPAVNQDAAAILNG